MPLPQGVLRSLLTWRQQTKCVVQFLSISNDDKAVLSVGVNGRMAGFWLPGGTQGKQQDQHSTRVWPAHAPGDKAPLEREQPERKRLSPLKTGSTYFPSLPGPQLC